MQDPSPIPSRFASGDKLTVDYPTTASLSATKSGQTIVSSIYRTKIAGHSRLITATWFRNLLVHSLSISIQLPEPAPGTNTNNHNHNHDNDYSCKIELRPWYFWRKLGSKKFKFDDGSPVRLIWDLRRAKFSGDPEPNSNYYVALVHDEQVVLVLGDLNTGYTRSSVIEATLVSKKEHLFGKTRFSTRSRFGDKGKSHNILIECGGVVGSDPEMVLRIDGDVAIHVKHLQWKFRGNETVVVSKGIRVEVYWDVHDWLFSPAGGVRHALFIFKPVVSSHSSILMSSSSAHHNGSSCFFLYAWKLE